MNRTALLIGIISVTLALVFYTITAFLVYKKEYILKKTIISQGLGLLFDSIGTVAMFLIRPGFSLSLHGIIGFFALGLMIIKLVLLLKFKDQLITKKLLVFFRTAYGVWVMIFIFGMML